MTYPKIGGKYLHYKGGEYEVTTLAKHTESEELLVVYRSLHFGSVFASPLSQWFETVINDIGYETDRFVEAK
jgi:hypothetical protein